MHAGVWYYCHLLDWCSGFDLRGVNRDFRLHLLLNVVEERMSLGRSGLSVYENLPSIVTIETA